jgi:hypothetical protein
MEDHTNNLPSGNSNAGRDNSQRPHLLWPIATALSLTAALILGINAHRLASDVSALDSRNRQQFAAISGQLSQLNEENARRLDELAQLARATAASSTEKAVSEARATKALSSKLRDQLAKEREAQQQTQEQVAGELDRLKQAHSSASSKLDELDADVNGVKGDVAATRSELQATVSDLRRVTGDMGVVSDRIATNGKELAELRELGEREYVEFDLKRNAGMQKVGGVQLAVAKTDPKHNRFSLGLLADDKRTDKRDRTINEPVQFYVAGGHQPYEIVVNQVKKDELIGYLAVPKVRVARR